LQGYDVCAWHHEIRNEAQAHERLEELEIDPKTASVFVDEDDEED
jgi:hypothetical protein